MHHCADINRSSQVVTGILNSNSNFSNKNPKPSKKTFTYHEDNPEWIPGPNLNQRRIYHAAGLGRDTATNEPFIAVTGGWNGSMAPGSTLDSVELLYEGETKWQAGKQQKFQN